MIFHTVLIMFLLFGLCVLSMHQAGFARPGPAMRGIQHTTPSSRMLRRTTHQFLFPAARVIKPVTHAPESKTDNANVGLNARRFKGSGARFTKTTAATATKDLVPSYTTTEEPVKCSARKNLTLRVHTARPPVDSSPCAQGNSEIPDMGLQFKRMIFSRRMFRKIDNELDFEAYDDSFEDKNEPNVVQHNKTRRSADNVVNDQGKSSTVSHPVSDINHNTQSIPKPNEISDDFAPINIFKSHLGILYFGDRYYGNGENKSKKKDLSFQMEYEKESKSYDDSFEDKNKPNVVRHNITGRSTDNMVNDKGKSSFVSHPVSNINHNVHVIPKPNEISDDIVPINIFKNHPGILYFGDKYYGNGENKSKKKDLSFQMEHEKESKSYDDSFQDKDEPNVLRHSVTSRYADNIVNGGQGKSSFVSHQVSNINPNIHAIPKPNEISNDIAPIHIFKSHPDILYYGDRYYGNGENKSKKKDLSFQMEHEKKSMPDETNRPVVSHMK